MRMGFSSVYIEDGIRKSCYALNNDTDEDNKHDKGFEAFAR